MRVAKKLLILCMGFVMTCTSLTTLAQTSLNYDQLDFGVGNGSAWPTQVNAPYMDMVAWVNIPAYSNNGAADLAKVAQETGVKYYNLGFIQSTGQVVDQKVQWGWGAYSVLSERNPNNTQYQGIKQSIRELREMGGDVAISFGGLNGTPMWKVTQDVDVLANTYLEIVDGYNLTRIDFDVEAAGRGYAANLASAKAIKKVQDQTGVKVSLTLPVLPDGLIPTDYDTFRAFLEAGVDVEVVNIMAMCYGSGVLAPGENYGTASLRAVESTMKQVQKAYKDYQGITLTEQEAYAKVGSTISAGHEGYGHPDFTVDWAKLVVDHAREKEIGMVSFWSMNRDALLDNNSGIPYQYAFTDVYKTFGQDAPTPIPNTAPTLAGIMDKTLKIGDSFDPKTGVTAYDKEDGDLTTSIQIEGSVDTHKAGGYTLTYTVEDSKGLKAVQTCQITVEAEIPDQNTAPTLTGITDKTIKIGDTFDPKAGVAAYDKEDGDLTTSIQIQGNVDTNKEGIYTLTYTVTDSKGVESVATCRITVEKVDNPNPRDTYDPTAIYNTGDKVIYEGKEYTAKWWTQGDLPGTSSVWEVARETNPDGSQNYIPGVVYNTGDVVVYNGKKYTAKWWTTSVPGSDSSWESEEVTQPDPDPIPDPDPTPDPDQPNGEDTYIPGDIYTGGDIVTYNGKQYKAKWWTMSVPGSDESWEAL